MSARLRAANYVVASLLLLMAGFAGGVFWAYRQVPEFYEQSLGTDIERQREANNELLAQATALASTARHDGLWNALFTAEQVNGWLAVDLRENWPDVLPHEIADPRVNLTPGHLTIACRYIEGQLSTVVSLDVELSLSEPNVLALRIRNMRAGVIPIPLAKVLDGLTELAAQMELPLRWTKAQGAPIALISLPEMRSGDGKQYELQSLEVRSGELYLAGRTKEASQTVQHLDPRSVVSRWLPK